MDKKRTVGTGRNKTGTIRDTTRTAGTKGGSRDNTRTNRDKTGTVMGKAKKTKVLDNS